MTLSCILLAAGSSLRFGKRNKLLLDIEGEPLIRRTAVRLLRSDIDEIYVVTGHDEKSVREALKGLPLKIIPNPNHHEGMGTSIAHGVLSLSRKTVGVFIVPGDMPEISATLIQKLGHAFWKNKGQNIICPQDADGNQKNPVLWPKDFIPHLSQLKGAKGGKSLIKKYLDRVIFVPASDPKTFLDIDTLKDLQAYQTRVRKTQ